MKGHYPWPQVIEVRSTRALIGAAAIFYYGHVCYGHIEPEDMRLYARCEREAFRVGLIP